MGVTAGPVFDGGWNAQSPSEESDSRSQRSPHLIETYKHLGSLVIEAMQVFGFTEESFAEYLRDQWRYLGDSEWPPAGAASTQREPKGPAVESEISYEDQREWETLIDRTTTIEAHISVSEDEVAVRSAETVEPARSKVMRKDSPSDAPASRTN